MQRSQGAVYTLVLETCRNAWSEVSLSGARACCSVSTQSNTLNIHTQDLSAGRAHQTGRGKVCKFLGKAPLAAGECFKGCRADREESLFSLGDLMSIM